MCNPALLAVAATGIGTGLQVFQQREIAQATNKAYEQNAAAARQAIVDGYDQLAVRSNQRRDASTQQSTANEINAARARATATAAASDSNIGGLTVDALLADINRQAATNASDIATNSEYAAAADQLQARGIRSQGVDRINAAPVGTFNPALGLLQIGAAAAQTYYATQYAKKQPAS